MPDLNGAALIRGTADNIAQRVRSLIVSGELPPGSALNWWSWRSVLA